MGTQMNNVMEEIKDGVDNVLQRQMDFEQRVHNLEKGASQSRIAGVMASNGYSAQDEGKFIKMAVANVLQREGRSDCFELAGFSAQDKQLVINATRKAMDTGTGGAGGGYVVPQQWVGTLIQMLRARLTVVQAGATLMEGLSGSPVIVPKQLTSASAYWIGQNASITASDPTFGQVQLTPKTLAIRAQYSNLLGILSNPSMEGIIRADFTKVAALELDRVALRGSGSANQPLGVNGVSGLGSYAIGANGGDLTRQDLLKMVGVVEDQNALSGKLGFIMSPKVARVLKNERIANYSGQTLENYTYYPLTDAQLAKTLDYPIYTTTQIPVNLTKGSSSDCSEVYFGNWEDLLLGMWGPVEILATNIGGNAWAQNAIEVRLIMNVDVQVRHGQSFVLCSDARVNNA